MHYCNYQSKCCPSVLSSPKTEKMMMKLGWNPCKSNLHVSNPESWPEIKYWRELDTASRYIPLFPPSINEEMTFLQFIMRVERPGIAPSLQSSASHITRVLSTSSTWYKIKSFPSLFLAWMLKSNWIQIIWNGRAYQLVTAPVSSQILTDYRLLPDSTFVVYYQERLGNSSL